MAVICSKILWLHELIHCKYLVTLITMCNKPWDAGV